MYFFVPLSLSFPLFRIQRIAEAIYWGSRMKKKIKINWNDLALRRFKCFYYYYLELQLITLCENNFYDDKVNMKQKMPLFVCCVGVRQLFFSLFFPPNFERTVLLLVL